MALDQLARVHMTYPVGNKKKKDHRSEASTAKTQSLWLIRVKGNSAYGTSRAEFSIVHPLQATATGA